MNDLDKFKSNDVILNAIAKGAIGDAFAQIGQPEEAQGLLQHVLEASNPFSAPNISTKLVC